MTSGWSQNPQNKVLQGTGHWELFVAATGIPGGVSCEEIVLNYFMREDGNPTQVTCNRSVLCFSVETCVMTCENAKAARANVVHVSYLVGVIERVCWG